MSKNLMLRICEIHIRDRRDQRKEDEKRAGLLRRLQVEPSSVG